MPIKAPAFKIRQKNIDIYVTSLKAKDLVDNSAISWWKREDKDGYQRPLSETRINQIKQYLLKDTATFPTSILANARGEIAFETVKTVDGGEVLCEITIPDSALPLWIIDGQHRIEGLKAAIAEDEKMARYPVIVSLFTLPKKYDEMFQFHIVNSRAKSVPTDLAQRHLFQMAGELGLPQLIEREGTKNALAAFVIPVIDNLATDPQSPWYQKIIMPDQPKKLKGQLIRQRPFADSVQSIVKERSTLRRDLTQLTSLLIDYWTALSELFPIAFSEPENYTIQGTPGLYSLHYVFPDVYDICAETGDLSKAALKGVLRKMFDNTSKILSVEVNDDFWNKTMGVGHVLAQSTSQKTMTALAEYFREALDTKQQTQL